MVRSKCSTLFAVAIDLSAACLPACLLLPHLCSCKTVLVDPMTMYHTSSSTTTVQCYYYTHEPALQLLIQNDPELWASTTSVGCTHLPSSFFWGHLLPFMVLCSMNFAVMFIVSTYYTTTFCPTLNLTFSFRM